MMTHEQQNNNLNKVHVVVRVNAKIIFHSVAADFAASYASWIHSFYAETPTTGRQLVRDDEGIP